MPHTFHSIWCSLRITLCCDIMAMKLICGCLLAVALLGCLADAQYPYSRKPQEPTKPQEPQQTYRPPQPQQVTKPQQPQKTYRPQQPQQLTKPQQPQQTYRPQQPQQTSKPQVPQTSKQPLVPTEVFHTCEVPDNYKVQCGAPGISSADCDAINCCYDGRMCYYGKSGKNVSVPLRTMFILADT